MREVVDYRAMERLRRARRRDRQGPPDGRGAEALLPLPVQAAGASTTITCRPSTAPTSRWSTCRTPRASSGSPRQGFVADGVEYEVDCIIFASGFEVTTDLERRWGIDRSRAATACRSTTTGGRFPDLPRHDQPQLPQPVLHRLHPGRRDRDHDRDVRAAGRPHRLHHQGGADARRHGGGAHRRSRGGVGRDHPGVLDRQQQVRDGNVRPVTTTARASRTGGRSSATPSGAASTPSRSCSRPGATRANWKA